MRLNKATTHAIRMLATCARTEELMKVSEIAARLDLSQQNAFKIVHLLSRAGFLKATRGRHGGVTLSQPAASIRVGDVVEAMEEMTFERAESDSGAKQSSDRLGLIDDAFAAFVAVLNQTTVADMAKAERKAEQSAAPAGRGKRDSGKTAKAGKTTASRRSSARA